MTMCRAQYGDHQVHYAFQISPTGTSSLSANSAQMQSLEPLLEMCTVGISHHNKTQAFGRLPANLPCTHSETHPINVGFRKKFTEQVFPGSARNQGQKYQCLMSNILRHKLAVLLACYPRQAGSPCSTDGTNWMNIRNIRSITLAALSYNVAMVKTTARVPNASKYRHYTQCCRITYLFVTIITGLLQNRRMPYLCDFTQGRYSVKE